jgi:tRNA (guanine26-N2/guanine27-N2)-dimethyltransferase
MFEIQNYIIYIILKLMKVIFPSSINTNGEIKCYTDYCKKNWSFVSENDTKFLVPADSLREKEPSKLPVFFNPAAKFNRDISIYIYKTFINNNTRKNISFVDAMTGSGIRGLRVANEIPKINRIYFNDFNIFSIHISKINAILNNVYNKCNFYNKDICNFLSTEFNFEKRATIVDIDPFGTPAPYLDCVLRSVENGGLISVTATDTAVLCGVYPKVCYRKYYGNPLRTKYSGEIGSRLLVSSIALIASRLDLSIIPIFSHGYRNYMRVYCKVVKSNHLANKIQEKLGYVIHCFNCGSRYSLSKLYNITDCNNCHYRVTIGGPLWISEIFDKGIIGQIVESIEKVECEMGKSNLLLNNIKNFFTITLNELDVIPYHFINDEIGKILKKNVMGIDRIIELLNRNGYQSSPTIFTTSGFKTDASIMDIKKILH